MVNLGAYKLMYNANWNMKYCMLWKKLIQKCFVCNLWKFEIYFFSKKSPLNKKARQSLFYDISIRPIPSVQSYKTKTSPICRGLYFGPKMLFIPPSPWHDVFRPLSCPACIDSSLLCTYFILLLYFFLLFPFSFPFLTFCLAPLFSSPFHIPPP